MKTRGESVRRVLMVLSVLRNSAKPWMRQRDLIQHVNTLTDRNYGRRTISRDIALLARLGVVARQHGYVQKLASSLLD